MRIRPASNNLCRIKRIPRFKGLSSSSLHLSNLFLFSHIISVCLFCLLSLHFFCFQRPASTVLYIQHDSTCLLATKCPTWLQGLWVILRGLPFSSVAAPFQPFRQVRGSGAESWRARSRRGGAWRRGQGIWWVGACGRGVVAGGLSAAGTQSRRRRGGLEWRRGVGKRFCWMRGGGGCTG